MVTLKGEEISLDKVLPIVADRKYNVTVRSGALAITTGGKIVEDGNSGNAVLFRRGETFTVTGNSVRTFDGRVYKLEETGYTIKHASYEPVQFKVDYEKTEREKDVYATFEMVKKNLADLLQDKEIDLILPKEMFVGGNVSGEQKVLDDFFGKNVVNIVAYNTEIGLDAAAQAVSSSVAKGRTPVFAATNSDVDRINTPGNEGTLEKIKQARVLVVPDLNDLKDNGWFFVREVEAEAMLHAILTEEDVTAKSTLAEDVRMSLAQLTGRKISMNELYTLLPFASVSEQIKAAINATDISAWLNLVKKLLLSMPMEAYDPKSELDARRRLMWSA